MPQGQLETGHTEYLLKEADPHFLLAERTKTREQLQAITDRDPLEGNPY